MNIWRLITESLWFYRRTNVAVLLAVVVATGVLTGALVVGDSVSYTLAKTLEARLGEAEFALVPQGRYFRAALADDLAEQLGSRIAPVLQVSGIITNADDSRRVNRVTVLGVDERFYTVGPGGNPFAGETSEAVVLSESVADRLGVTAGEEIVLRIEKPGLMPRDVPLVSDKDRTVAFRLPVQTVAGTSDFGRFDLRANQTAPLNVFVSLAWLGEQIEQEGRANLLLAARVKPGITADEVNAAVQETWRLADAGLELRRLAEPNALELRSRRIFIEESFGAEAAGAAAGAESILTYFVNEIRLGEKATPYSMVAAIGGDADIGHLIPPGMGGDEIVINRWLADDLGAAVGDFVEMTYYLVGPKRKLHEARSRFKVIDVIELAGLAKDPNLMPNFPGLADAENCRDWEPGIPIDLDRIRPKDEQYWDTYRGTPKAFIALEAGQVRWRNRYGNLTAVRYPHRAGLAEQIEEHLRGAVDPAQAGLFFQPVRQRGAKAGREGTDFGQLFLGLSMFLIAAAVILTGLLFVFGVESRADQVGMLLAVGWPMKRVKRLLLAEGGLVALLGTLVGVGAGVVYTRLMIYGLSTLWSGAVTGTAIQFHADSATLAAGGLGGLAAALFAVWVTLRKQVSRPACQLMAGNLEPRPDGKGSRLRGKLGLLVAIVAFAGVITFLALMAGGDSQAVAGAFFGAGALLLLGELGLGHAVLRILAVGWDRPMVSLRGLGFRSSARRTGRSLAIVGLLACGVFMVVAVGANRRNALKAPQSRSSGTGGFALYAESAVAILHDMNGEAGRKELGLDQRGLEGVETVQFRVREGDDASCFNLNRAQQPRLLGVDPKELARRGAFTFTGVVTDADETGWDLLDMDRDTGVVPTVGDYPTVFWALGKNIGDELEYSDEKGRTLRVRIVGMVESCILQGSLVIAENEFVARFPSVDGYGVFLIDAPAEAVESVSDELSSALRDYGLVLTPAVERQAAFGAVENTYLSIFMVLGGLGLVLGSIGLGLVVLRNMLERRGELAMLRAVGFDKVRLKRMVFYEHGGLMLAGLVCGVLSAVIAVIPALQSPGGAVPYLSLAATVLLIALSGAIWVWIAAGLALRGHLLDALRVE